MKLILVLVLITLYAPSVVCLFTPLTMFAFDGDRPSEIEIPGYFILSNLSDKNLFGKITSVLAFVLITPYFITGCVGFAIARMLWLLWYAGEKH